MCTVCVCVVSCMVNCCTKVLVYLITYSDWSGVNLTRVDEWLSRRTRWRVSVTSCELQHSNDNDTQHSNDNDTQTDKMACISDFLRAAALWWYWHTHTHTHSYQVLLLWTSLIDTLMGLDQGYSHVSKIWGVHLPSLLPSSSLSPSFSVSSPSFIPFSPLLSLSWGPTPWNHLGIRWSAVSFASRSEQSQAATQFQCGRKQDFGELWRRCWRTLSTTNTLGCWTVTLNQISGVSRHPTTPTVAASLAVNDTFRGSHKGHSPSWHAHNIFFLKFSSQNNRLFTVLVMMIWLSTCVAHYAERLR